MKSVAIFFIWVALFACTSKTANEKGYDPYGHIQDDRVRAILKRAIDKAGGFEAWAEINTIKYTKHNKLLLEDGRIESENIQRHEYVMQPQFSARISWEENDIDHLILYDPGKAEKYQNDSLVSDDPSETVMSSLYVLGMPFKLLDGGTNLDYSGTTVIDDKWDADVIKATYSPVDHENHSTQDEWYYYFEVNDGTFLGAMVYHPPTYAYIRNLGFVEDTPVKFHAHRRSYRVDSARNIRFLRAEFLYSDYQVE